MAENILSVESLLSSVFISVSSNGGKISSFSYHRNACFGKGSAGGLCSFSLCCCDLEKVVALHYCVLSFEKGEPRFEMLLPLPISPCVQERHFACEPFSEADFSLAMTLRKKLRNLGAVFEIEYDSDAVIEFNFFAGHEILYSCLKSIGSEAENALWSEKSIEVSESNGLYRVRLSFSKNSVKDDFHPLLLISRFSYLFGTEIARPKIGKKFLLPGVKDLRRIFYEG